MVKVSTQRLTLPGALLSGIGEHAEAGYPEEICGGLLGARFEDGSIEIREAIAIDNSRTDERNRRYLISPREVLELERRAGKTGLNLVGFYHSHPDAPAVPSDFDRQHAWPWYTYVIASVRNGELAMVEAWRLRDDRSTFDRLEIDSAVSRP